MRRGLFTLAMLLSVLVASCTSGQSHVAPVSASSTAPGKLVTQESQQPTSAPAPFMGKRSELDASGGHSSIAEQPFAFLGRLRSGQSDCDESVGFTFANVKDLGLSADDCTYNVEHSDANHVTTWSAMCQTVSKGVNAVVSEGLFIEDKSFLGTDGKTEVRPALFVKRIDAEGFDEAILECTYSGHILPRTPPKWALDLTRPRG